MPARNDLVIKPVPCWLSLQAGHLDVLRKLLGKVTVPYEVVREIEAGGRTQFAREEFVDASWLEKRPAPITLATLAIHP